MTVRIAFEGLGKTPKGLLENNTDLRKLGQSQFLETSVPLSHITLVFSKVCDP